MKIDALKCAAMLERMHGLEEWLQENNPEVFTEQKHCDEGTMERVYWHYGYMVALRDVIRNFELQSAVN